MFKCDCGLSTFIPNFFCCLTLIDQSISYEQPMVDVFVSSLSNQGQNDSLHDFCCHSLSNNGVQILVKKLFQLSSSSLLHDTPLYTTLLY